jgi:hypothetical protein
VEVGVPPSPEVLGVGMGSAVVPPLSDAVPSSVGPEEVSGSADEPFGELDGESAGLGPSSPDFVDEDVSCPVTAALTVVPLPPLKLSPDTSSYTVIPAMVTPKTRAAASTGRFQLPTRAR